MDEWSRLSGNFLALSCGECFRGRCRGGLVPLSIRPVADPCGCFVGTVQYRLWDRDRGILSRRISAATEGLACACGGACLSRLSGGVFVRAGHPSGHPHEGMGLLEETSAALADFDELTVRQLVSNIKVLDRDSLLVRFKDGTELVRQKG